MKIEIKEGNKVIATMLIERSYTGITPMGEKGAYKIKVTQENERNGQVNEVDTEMELTRSPFPMAMVREALNNLANPGGAQ